MSSLRCNSRIKSWRNKKDPQRITKIKSFINKYNWEGVNYPSEKNEWKKIEKNNVTIVLNVLYAKKENIYPAYVSKHNSNCEKQINGSFNDFKRKKTMVLSSSQKISALLRGVSSKHHGGFYCLNCLLFFTA